MNAPLKRLFLLIALASGVLAHAALPEPPDPREVAQLTPQQRFEQARSLHRRWSKPARKSDANSVTRCAKKWTA